MTSNIVERKEFHLLTTEEMANLSEEDVIYYMDNDWEEKVIRKEIYDSKLILAGLK